MGGQFRLQAAYRPPPAGLRPPSQWGTRSRLEELFGDQVTDLETTEQYIDLVHHSTADLFALFRDWFGPIATLVAQADAEQAEAFRRDLIALSDEHNIATDGTCEIPSPYLQVVAVKRP